MKRISTLFLTLFTVISFAFLTSANAQNFTAAKTRSMDEQVYRKLKYLPNSNVFDHITWQVSGSTVILSGKVYTLGTKDAAARAVRDIAGVSEVVNNIEMLPASPMDDRIRREALIAFTNGGPAQYFSSLNPAVRVIVENGRLTLEGYVARKSDSDLLNILSNTISGVFKVTNNLVVGERKF